MSTSPAGGSIDADLVLATPEDTHRFGVRLGQLLRAGDLVILAGGLGAGKTALTKGIAVGMDVLGPVTSPTFVIARTHRPAGDGPGLVHVDAYRLSGSVELADLDLDTDLTRSALVVEWGAGVAEELAEAHLLVELDRRPDDTRWARLTAVGGDWETRRAQLL